MSVACFPGGNLVCRSFKVHVTEGLGIPVCVQFSTAAAFGMKMTFDLWLVILGGAKWTKTKYGYFVGVSNLNVSFACMYIFKVSIVINITHHTY